MTHTNPQIMQFHKYRFLKNESLCQFNERKLMLGLETYGAPKRTNPDFIFFVELLLRSHAILLCSHAIYCVATQYYCVPTQYDCIPSQSIAFPRNNIVWPRNRLCGNAIILCGHAIKIVRPHNHYCIRTQSLLHSHAIYCVATQYYCVATQYYCVATQ